MLAPMITALVTGANRGIGLELTRQLAARPDTAVIAACRTPSDALYELDIELETGVEVTSADAVAGLARRLEGRPIDVLINSAGVLFRGGLGDLDFDRVRLQLEVNALGPLRVAAALRPNLRRGAKLAVITSRMGSIGDNTSGGYYGYRMSKAAVNAAAVSLARDLAPGGVAVAILHPGHVRTDMTGWQGLVDASESAAGLLARIDELSLETTGTFWHMNGEVLPW